MPTSPAAKKPNERLSKQLIVDTAISFADEHGLDGLSMRKLATELGTGAMSLYNHVANKDDLVVAMIDVVFDMMKPPTEASAAAGFAEWRHAMRASAISTRDAYVRHPWAVAAAMSTVPGPRRLAHTEIVLGAFAASGLPRDPAHHAYHAYEVHISGFMLAQLAFEYEGDELKEAAREFLSYVDHQAFPHVVAHVQEHLEDRGSDFEFGLDLLLNGFERLQDASAAD